MYCQLVVPPAGPCLSQQFALAWREGKASLRVFCYQSYMSEGGGLTTLAAVVISLYASSV